MESGTAGSATEVGGSDGRLARRNSAAALQAPQGTRGSTMRRPGVPPRGGTPGPQTYLAVVVGARAFAQVRADVVEAAAARAEARVDLVELGRVEGRTEALQALAVVEPELRGEVVALEQADVVDAAGQRLRRLDLDRAVALEPGGGRDQLADDDVLLQAREAVDLALERRVGEHLGGLLEGGRRQERVRRQRRLGDAEDDLLGLGALAPGVDDLLVELAELVAVDELPGQQVGVALLVDPDLLEHLTADQLDVLVVDVHALGLVDLLHLLDEVHLGLRPAADRQQLVRVQRALVELRAGLDLLALVHVQAGTPRERVPMLLAGVVGDDDGARLVGVLDGDGAAQLGDF